MDRSGDQLSYGTMSQLVDFLMNKEKQNSLWILISLYYAGE